MEVQAERGKRRRDKIDLARKYQRDIEENVWRNQSEKRMAWY